MEIKEYKTSHNNFKNIEKSKINRGRIQLTRRIWSVRAIELYDELPLEITKCDKISILKKLLKKWIRTNIPMKKND